MATKAELSAAAQEYAKASDELAAARAAFADAERRVQAAQSAVAKPEALLKQVPSRLQTLAVWPIWDGPTTTKTSRVVTAVRHEGENQPYVVVSCTPLERDAD